jgi:hypothetical protein
MGNRVQVDFPTALRRTQRKFGQWRERCRPRAPIPEGLWREAAELACAHGINRTARALRLDYYSLKKRAVAAARTGEPATEFVEVIPGGMPVSQPECTIELEEASGVKMRIRLQGGSLPDIADLARAFRECRS